jgi:hypothetical protein
MTLWDNISTKEPKKIFSGLIKLISLEVAGILLIFLFFRFLLGYAGFSEFIKGIWEKLLMIVLFFNIFYFSLIFTLSSRIDEFSKNIKKSYLITLGLLTNFITIIYTKPALLGDFSPFRKDLVGLWAVVVAWIIFPFLSSDRIKKILPRPILIILVFAVYFSVFMSVFMFAFLDTVTIFYSLLMKL